MVEALLSEQRLIPRDLFDGHPVWSPRFRRLAVTAFVLCGPTELISREQHQQAMELWGQRLERDGRVTVASALIELESLGACRDIQEHDAHLFSVEVGT